MGQQQLLLLVLGTVIVGVAIVVGINVFNSGAVQANQDAVVQDVLTIAGKALNWAKTPQLMGGGMVGDTPGWTGWTDLPTTLNWPETNANGRFEASVEGNVLTITGTGVEGSEVAVTVDPTQAAGSQIGNVSITPPSTT